MYLRIGRCCSCSHVITHRYNAVRGHSSSSSNTGCRPRGYVRSDGNAPKLQNYKKYVSNYMGTVCGKTHCQMANKCNTAKVYFGVRMANGPAGSERSRDILYIYMADTARSMNRVQDKRYVVAAAKKNGNKKKCYYCPSMSKVGLWRHRKLIAYEVLNTPNLENETFHYCPSMMTRKGRSLILRVSTAAW